MQGTPYLTNIFVKEANLGIQNRLKSYTYQSESGSRSTKKFSEKRVYQMFTFDEGRPELVRFNAGTVNELEVINYKETSEYCKRYL